MESIPFLKTLGDARDVQQARRFVEGPALPTTMPLAGDFRGDLYGDFLGMDFGV